MIIRTITPEFTDERGEIRNLPMHDRVTEVSACAPHLGDISWHINNAARNIALITSKAGSVRSNHWHKRSSHWCYVVSGILVYYERAIGSSGWGEGTHLHPGLAVFTGPAVEHRMEFPVDAVIISISDMPQTTAEHEEDVVRI